MTPIEAAGTKPLKRNVNIDSAIDQSSFQMPVFVAISSEGSEAQVAKIFATARDVFEHVFSILLDCLLQHRAVEAVEGLVPASAHFESSRDTEYVLLVRGNAIFWFSGVAAKRSAGRRMLLERARELAEAEQAPFYILNTLAKRIRAAVIAFGLFGIIPVAFAITPKVIDWARHLARDRPLPAVSVAEYRDATVARRASSRAKADDTPDFGDYPAPIAARQPSAAVPNRRSTETSQGRPSPASARPDRRSDRAIITDRFPLWGVERRWPQIFIDPLPSFDIDLPNGRAATTIIPPENVAAMPTVAVDPIAGLSSEADQARRK